MWFWTVQIRGNVKKWSRMVSNGFPLTPVTRIHGCLGSGSGIDQPPGAPHWETEIWWEFLCHPMTLKSQTLAAKCCPRRAKWLPKVTLKWEIWFSKTFVLLRQNNTLWSYDTFQTYQRNKSRNLISFLTPNTKKWASCLQSASQWAPPGNPKFTEFHRTNDLGSQRAAFGARSCIKTAKMVLRAPQMTHFPSDYQSNLMAGGAYPDWNLMSIPIMSPKVNSSAWFVGRGETPKVGTHNPSKIVTNLPWDPRVTPWVHPYPTWSPKC